MLRNGAARLLARSNAKLPTSLLRNSCTLSPIKTKTTSNAFAIGLRRPSSLAVSLHKPVTAISFRYATTAPTGPGFDRPDKKLEEKVATSEIKPHPEAVSADSSVRHILREEGVDDVERDVDMLAGVKSDLKTIRETFSMEDVPREALYIGMAGVLPYLATSLSTVYLAWDINHASITGSGFLVSGQTAELLLHIIEPIQIGYGAVILSFLGAIHWGLEYAKFGGSVGYRRYAYGVITTAVAWPTLLFPIEYALISQFLAFTFLYFADARATARGWAPSWYGVYRFALTFIVGASLVASLIGRGQIADQINRLPGPADRIKALRDAQMEQLEEEEKAKRARIAEEDEDEEDED